ncbi:hypothetical protein K439DRAFT_1635298 [Ramaria rubella]|nr:hypothetical protein K439DRAFT_1635298 [Ramaria rubella]
MIFFNTSPNLGSQRDLITALLSDRVLRVSDAEVPMLDIDELDCEGRGCAQPDDNYHIWKAVWDSHFGATVAFRMCLCVPFFYDVHLVRQLVHSYYYSNWSLS